MPTSLPPLSSGRKVRVLVVNDSATMRMALRLAFLNAPDVEIVGEVSDGARAVAAVEDLSPDVVLMDVVMPGVDGYEATRRIMERRPTPILMISSVVNPRDVHVALEALRAGALALAEAPPPPSDAQYEARRKFLLRSVVTLARANPARRVPRAIAPKTPTPASAIPLSRVPSSSSSPTSSASPASSGSASAPSPTSSRAPARPPVTTERTPVERARASEHRAARSSDAVGIAASTGGPTALLDVLRALPKGEAPPILVVQHIARGFGTGLARWLGETTGHPVLLATHGATLVRGVVYIAPDDVHLGLSEGGTIALSDAPSVGYFRPSATHLFRSMAASLGSRAAGVVLTGMGNDGAEGAAILWSAGGQLAVQDEASSVVFGMPAAALERVPDADVLALPDVAAWIRARNGSSWLSTPPAPSPAFPRGDK